MSQSEPTDLLCSSRREELTAEDQRRLSESMRHSLEVRLMSQILPELERESQVRPGDDVLLARINARALAELSTRVSPIRAPAKRRTVMLLAAAAVLMVAGLAAALLGGVKVRRTPAPTASAIITPGLKPKPVVKPKPSSALAPDEPRELIEPTLGEPTPVPSASAPKREARTAPGSASELFVRANTARRQGHGAEATALYEQLLELYPSSREVGPTRLALAKYLQRTQPERAMAQYRALVRGGGTLRAEGLWGISETALRLGQAAVADQALADLLREFPESPYAEVARARALNDPR